MIVGIDIGGTKTHVMAHADGAIVLDLTVASETWRRGAILDDESNIARLLDTIARLDDGDRAALAIGAHGIDSDRQVEILRHLVALHHRGPTVIVNDVELIAPAAGLADAIAVVAGTGSKVVGHASDGSPVTAGGYGFVLGDPGSSASIVRDAVRAVLNGHDDGAPIDELGRLLLSHFAVPDFAALAASLTDVPRILHWSTACPVVFDALELGSALAGDVVIKAAGDLAHQVAQVHARGAVAAHVVCAGGVVSNQPALYSALTERIEALGFRLQVHLLPVPPAVGALELARRISAPASTHHLWRTT